MLVFSFHQITRSDRYIHHTETTTPELTSVTSVEEILTREEQGCTLPSKQSNQNQEEASTQAVSCSEADHTRLLNVVALKAAMGKTALNEIRKAGKSLTVTEKKHLLHTHTCKERRERSWDSGGATPKLEAAGKSQKNNECR